MVKTFWSETKKVSKFFLVTFIVVNMFFSIARGEPILQKNNDREAELIVGYSSKIFLDVDIKDARAATKIWTDKLVRRMGSSFNKSEVVIFDELTTLENMIKAQLVDIIVLFSQEYLEVRNRSLLVPVFASDYGKNFYYELLIIVRRDSGINQFSDLKKKRIVVELGQKESLPMLWLETLLAREGFFDPKAYFSNIKAGGRASQVVLPVFFRQADGSIAGRKSFEMMTELNPQVGKELKVLTISPGFLTGVVCLRKDFYQQHSTIITDTLKAFYEDPEGKQIMMLFKVNKLLPFKYEYLESVESLLKEHRDLTTRMVKRK